MTECFADLLPTQWRVDLWVDLEARRVPSQELVVPSQVKVGRAHSVASHASANYMG